DADPSRLDVLGVDPVVPLVRRGPRHDLADVGGIRQHLLVAAHGGVEHGLSERLVLGPERLPPERRAVLEHQEGWAGGPAHLVGCPSFTVNLPRNMVWRTHPRSRRPVKAEFRACDWKGRSPTVHSVDGSKTTRLAGRPGATGPPWSSRPRIRAGPS